VTLDDIETANRLAHEVLGRTLDELPPQTRKLLTKIKTLASDECKKQKIKQSDYRFSRKVIREYTGMGNTQLKIHCGRLEDMEYLLVHRGGRGLSMEYELIYNNEDNNNKPHLMGLIDVDTLKKCTYDKKKSGVKAEKSVSSRPQVGGVSGQVKTRKANGDKAVSVSGSEMPKSTIRVKKQTEPSYTQEAVIA